MRTWTFHCCLGVVGLGAATLVFLSLSAVFQPIGLRIGPVSNPFAEHLVMGLAIASILVALRLLLLRYPGVRLACFAILWAAYLSLIGMTIHGRSEALEALTALYQ